jgi:tetratricopeptide (TPR) repeat protein
LLADRGSDEAAKLLGLPLQEKRLRDEDELKTISPEGFELFTKAEALATQPNSPDLDGAILKYGECLAKEPRFHLGYARLAMAYIRQYRRMHDPILLKLASQNAEKAADENSLSAAGLLSRAQVYLYSGVTEKALDFINRSLRVDPGNPQTMVYKGYAYQYLNRLPDSDAVYKAIIHDRPNFWPAYNELAVNQWRQGKYTDAADTFDSASNVAPNVALPLANMGAMYVAIGKRDEAIDASKRSLQRAKNEEAYRNLGDIAFGDKQYKEALAYYQQSAELEPKSHKVWRDIGDCYTVMGNEAKVRESYQKAAKSLGELMATNPRNGAGWMSLAFYDAKKYGASDVRSKFMKVQALAVLGRKQEALPLLLECMKQGITQVDVDLALDLKDLKRDPKYLAIVTKTPGKQSAAT